MGREQVLIFGALTYENRNEFGRFSPNSPLENSGHKGLIKVNHGLEGPTSISFHAEV